MAPVSPILPGVTTAVLHTWLPTPPQELMKGEVEAPASSFYAEGFLRESPFPRTCLRAALESL